MNEKHIANRVNQCFGFTLKPLEVGEKSLRESVSEEIKREIEREREREDVLNERNEFKTKGEERERKRKRREGERERETLLTEMMRGRVLKTALTSAEGEGRSSERGEIANSNKCSKSFTYLQREKGDEKS